MWCHWHDRGGVGCVIQGGSVMESYQFEILDQYFSVIVTIPHISIKSQSLCIPTYFSVYLKPQEVIIMHKIHKYLKTFLSSRWWHLSSWHHMIMAGTQSNFQIWQAYNIWGWWDGTRHLPLARPCDGPPSQPHSLTATLTLSTFNLISINYANVWLHTLNVVEGFNMNCIKIYSIILSVTCHSLRNFPPLIHIPSYPFMNFQNPVSYYFLS